MYQWRRLNFRYLLLTHFMRRRFTALKYPFGYEHLASLIRVADLAVKKSDDQKGEAGHDGISGPGLAGQRDYADRVCKGP